MAESISASADRHDLSDDEREGGAALINSPLDFIRMTLKIQNKRQELVPLEPNLPQQMFYDEYRRQEEAGRPVRIIILKARQMGFSTMTSALFYHIAGDYDMYYVGTSTEPLASREQNKQRILEAYSLAMNNPLVQQDAEAQLNLLRKVLEAMEIRNVEQLLPRLPQPVTAEGTMMGTMTGAAPAETMMNGVASAQLPGMMTADGVLMG